MPAEEEHDEEDEDGDPVPGERNDVASEDEDAACGKGLRNGKLIGDEINLHSLEELYLEPDTIHAVQGTFQLLVSSAASQDAAGEAIFQAIFHGAASLKALFKTPPGVQGVKFMNALSGFVMALDDPVKLKSLVETVSFAHLSLEVTIPRAQIFRDLVLDFLIVDLSDKLTDEAREGWRRLLNYVGGAIIFCKGHYAERVNILLDSWKIVSARKEKPGHQQDIEDSSEVNTSVKKDDSEGSEDSGGRKQLGVQNIPTNYADMFTFNSVVMGMGDRLWMQEVLAVFDKLVTNVSNASHLQDEVDVLALRISTIRPSGAVHLQEYKSCMLASLRALLPKDWTTNHELAWCWFWEYVERLLSSSEFFVRGIKLERALARFLDGLEEPQKYQLQQELHLGFFATTKAAERFFKQSHSYLHMVAGKVFDMSYHMYKEPIKMVDDISALGLRHVGYGAPTHFFPLFVNACMDVLGSLELDKVAEDSFRCSLGLVAKLLARTITEGSTIVMKAVNSNSAKLLNKAVSLAPRAERSGWMLLVQVGTQQISPFYWALESGNLEAAAAIINDLLTIRADRDMYYYAVDALFDRHHDLVKRLIDDAPGLLPTLLDGLIWRARLSENGLRRVNYYLKHLLVDCEGNCAGTMEWIVAVANPKIVCHPMLVQLTDLVWDKATYKSFLRGKMWLFFTLAVFICSQSIQGLRQFPQIVFGCRCFVYICSLSELVYRQVTKFIVSYQKGDTVKLFCFVLPGHLKDWRESCSLLLALALFMMFVFEPILVCWADNGGKPFTDECAASEGWLFPYSFCSMMAMFFYYILLVDLSVFSNKVSAYVLLAGELTSEFGLYVCALAATIFTISSSISCLNETVDDFRDILKGCMSLFEIFLKTYDLGEFELLKKRAVLFLVVCIFLLTSILLLSNLLVAQFTAIYSDMMEDMIGYARLSRMEIVVTMVHRISRRRWDKFIVSLALDEPLEFNKGDIGIAGGIQVFEPAAAHPTSMDRVKRYGGSTRPTMPWPADDDESGEDRFARLEKMLQKTIQKAFGGDGRAGRGGNSAVGSSRGRQSQSRSSGEGSQPHSEAGSHYEEELHSQDGGDEEQPEHHAGPRFSSGRPSGRLLARQGTISPRGSKESVAHHVDAQEDEDINALLADF